MQVVDGDLVDALTILGLSRKEATVLAYLLLNGNATAREIMTDLSIHQPQLYNIMVSLERKGFINVQQSKPKVYTPIGMGVIMEMIENEMLKRKQAVVKALTSLTRGDRVRNLLWVTRGIDNVIYNSASLIQEATSELYVSAPPVLLSRLIKHISNLDPRVKAYILVYPSLDDELLSRLKGIKSLVEVKVNKLGPFYFISSNAESCVFAPSKVSLLREAEPYGYVFRDRIMTLQFIHGFFDAWRRAQTIYRRGFKTSDYPLVFNSHRFATWEILKAKESKLSIEVRVKGYLTSNNEEADITGVPLNVTIDSDVVNFELLPSNGGKALLVGGTNALIEDIESEYIEIKLRNQ
ncbi:TrmB family transcriptional regulator [Caldivirga sp. UBA161]|uniref:TrmB family transcriptional regulator n=1 Tax=Caldivirga sp. UBA161 TaxID=1915569 RepID=UPI0025C5C961|nr:TrmB family transcriptional regulator [Caldivirga sp. UBA161]